MSRQRNVGPEIPSKEVRESALGFDNVDFFSEYFLRDGLWTNEDLLNRLDIPGTDEAGYKLYRAHALTFGLDSFSSEQETYSRWVRPMLKSLGYEPAGKVEIQTDRGLLAVNHTHAFGVAPAGGAPDTRPRILIQTEAWGTDLDAARDGLTGRATPTAQAFACLRHAESRARWAIVTNGQELRLIGSDLGLPPRAHLSFDLEHVFQRSTKKDVAFILFWGLLREGATRPGEEEKSFLDVILDESRRLAQSVRGALGDVVPHLLEQLVRDMRESNPDFREQADADEAHRTAVILLYRLLFVAYAEAKGLLPISNQLYRDAYSFESLRHKIDDKKRAGTHWPAGRHTLWPQLQSLFRFLTEDLSTPDLPIMPLGGRLFEPDATPWLPRIKLNDAQVAVLVEGLSLADVKRGRSKKAVSRERINYADLDISELGSIYESLLEYKPVIAKEPIVVIVSDRGEQTIPERLAGTYERKKDDNAVPILYPPGEFYLATWNGLRKGSGTYYTPRALTEFQARNALEPLTREAIENGEPEKILRLKICDPAMGSAAFLVACVQELAQRLEEACIEASRPEKYAHAVGRIRTTDLGERIADALLTVVERARGNTLEEDERALLARLAAEHCIYGVDINPMAVELARVSLWLATFAKDQPLTFVDDRLVCGNSLIGATISDLDPKRIPEPIILAATKDLRGAKRAATDGALRSTKQRTLGATSGGLKSALDVLATERGAIAAIPTTTVEEARWKAQALRDLRETSSSPLPRLLQISHLWTATWFWDDPGAATALAGARLPNPEQWQSIVQCLLTGSQPSEEEAAIISAAERLGEARHHFCWELNFPEVFEQGGFDVIIGNPPWEAVRRSEKEWGAQYNPTITKKTNGREFDEWLDSLLIANPRLRQEYDEFMAGQRAVGDYFSATHHFPIPAGRDVNTYKFFLQRALALARTDGVVSQILPGSLGRGEDAGPLRVELLRRTQLAYWIDFANTKKIFPIDSSLHFVVFVGRCGAATEILPCRFYEGSLDSLRAYPGTGLLRLPTELIRKLGGEELAFTEFRDQSDINPLARLYVGVPMLGEAGAWKVRFRTEFHTGNDKDVFNNEGVGWPVLKGESFHPFDAGPYDFEYTAAPDVARGELVARLEKSKDPDFAEAFQGKPPCDLPRVVFRKVAKPENWRTMIAARIPPGFFLTDAAPQLVVIPPRPEVEYYLVGVLNSLWIDYVVRNKVQGNLTWNYVEKLPVLRPPVDEILSKDHRLVAELSCRLHHGWSAMCPIAPVEAHQSPPCDMLALEAALNVIVAKLYGMPQADVDHILPSFRQVDPLLRRVISNTYERTSSLRDAERISWELVAASRVCTHGCRPPWVSRPFSTWDLPPAPNS